MRNKASTSFVVPNFEVSIRFQRNAHVDVGIYLQSNCLPDRYEKPEQKSGKLYDRFKSHPYLVERKYEP